MRRPRLLTVACCLVLAVACLGAPAIALAGGSAGDQQYTDPFSGGSPGGGSATATAPAQTETATAPAQTTPAESPDTTPAPTAPADTTPSETTPVEPSTEPDPTATVAAPSTGTLPYTGYAAWTAAGFGAVLLGAGLALRLRTRPAR